MPENLSQALLLFLNSAVISIRNCAVILPCLYIKIYYVELEPNNLTALQIRAQTEYEKCAFERALVLAHRGQRARQFPPDFAECARHAEETV